MTESSPTTNALVTLGAERLAEALIELADRNDDASRMVTRLTALPQRKGVGTRRNLRVYAA